MIPVLVEFTYFLMNNLTIRLQLTGALPWTECRDIDARSAQHLCINFSMNSI